MTAPMARTALVALLLSLPVAAVAGARPAAPSAPAARTPELTADPIAVQAGDTVTLTGAGFPRNVHVNLLAGPPHAEATRIGGASTGRRGRFVATIRIRPRADPGVLVVQACHDTCRVKATARFRIVAP